MLVWQWRNNRGRVRATQRFEKPLKIGEAATDKELGPGKGGATGQGFDTVRDERFHGRDHFFRLTDGAHDVTVGLKISFVNFEVPLELMKK